LFDVLSDPTIYVNIVGSIDIIISHSTRISIW